MQRENWALRWFEAMKRIEQLVDELKPGIKVLSVYEKMKPDARLIDKVTVIRKRGAAV